MADSIPKILILESGEAARKRICQILEEQGWEVVCETVSKQALSRLKKANTSPFHLFISNFKLPKMEGDNILKFAKSISPMTQRMLMVPADQSDMVIRAINKAEIHACIVTPATNQDLIDKVRSCLKQFKRDIKHDRLKRVIAHQNKQMFVIARRLKKKDQTCQKKNNERKGEKLRLNTLIGKATRSQKTAITLDERIRTREIPITKETLEAEFDTLLRVTRTLFDQVASEADLTPSFSDMNRILAENTSPSNPESPEIIRKILKTVFSAPDIPVPGTPEPVEKTIPEELTLEELLSIRLSSDAAQAFIHLTTKNFDPDILTLEGLLELLREQNITFGIVDDQTIASWLKTPDKGPDEFLIAQGDIPAQGKDGTVKYSFKTDYTNPGKILEDGRMDFRDKGEIPFVDKEDVLAVKTPPRPGSNGMTVAGEVIGVDDPLDPVFIAGSGTRLSEDGLTIHADLSGQPHLDSMGEITVNPELPINGDIDFQTGNIEFNGNIIVTGRIKEGFTVKGANLTAREIEGATITLSGDLHVSDGITDADIVSVGNVYAKFINNSTVSAFGNIIIQKEIIDSQILLSGLVENPTGVIIASKITAKAGVDAGNIGTQSSDPARLRVGTNDHIDTRIQALDTRLGMSIERLGQIKQEIELVENEDQALYGRIMDKAQEQERLQGLITAFKKKEAEFKTKGRSETSQAVKEIQDLSSDLKKIDRELSTIFKIQDRHAKRIEQYKSSIDEIEAVNKALVLKKKGLREFAKKTRPRPTVTVKKSIIQNSVIVGPNASITLKEDRTRCRISEKIIQEEGHQTIEMEISEL